LTWKCFNALASEGNVNRREGCDLSSSCRVERRAARPLRSRLPLFGIRGVVTRAQDQRLDVGASLGRLFRIQRHARHPPHLAHDKGGKVFDPAALEREMGMAPRWSGSP